MRFDEIVQEALRLPASARLEIMDLLRQSLDKPDPEIDQIGGEEAVRRLAAYDAGHSKSYSMDEVLGND